MNRMNSKFFDSLDRGIQHLIEWQYRFSGDFNRALFETICLADKINMARLYRGFPLEVDAYLKYTRKEGWWQKIQKGLFSSENGDFQQEKTKKELNHVRRNPT